MTTPTLHPTIALIKFYIHMALSRHADMEFIHQFMCERYTHSDGIPLISMVMSYPGLFAEFLELIPDPYDIQWESITEEEADEVLNFIFNSDINIYKVSQGKVLYGKKGLHQEAILVDETVFVLRALGRHVRNISDSSEDES